VVYFLALTSELDNESFIEVCRRLAVTEQYSEKLSDMRSRGERVLEAFARRSSKSRPVQRSEIHRLFSDLSVEVLLFLMARTRSEDAKKSLSLYFTQLQGVHCLLTGDDILAMGVPRGPEVGRLLDCLLAARLNGEVISRDDEQDYLKKYLSHTTGERT